MTPCNYATGEIDSNGHTLGLYPKAQKKEPHQNST